MNTSPTHTPEIKAHSFHIPVMGIGFTIDAATRVAPYGIDTVASLLDDGLMERLRKKLCAVHSQPYEEISRTDDDCRAKRTTAYLNLLKFIVEKRFDQLINSPVSVEKYFSLLPPDSELDKRFKAFRQTNPSQDATRQWLKDNLTLGSIDVNIMTKLDKINYKNGERLPSDRNDAHSALRGFANSDLESSIVFSAGMNPSLYGYIQQFSDFFPDEKGHIRKKVTIKVSDYRSAIIQGKFLAKKGIWVSEYRMESGLNCGGHAFATDGFLMGPILEEFKNNRGELYQTVFSILQEALASKNLPVPESLPMRITAQGGVGTSEEHDFLLEYYQLDSIGWGTPFLLVPEVTNVDDFTLQKMMEAKEKDLYLSTVSPLGVLFNNLRGNSKEIEQEERIKSGKPGSPCHKKNLALNVDKTGNNICAGSNTYQAAKIKELDDKNLSPEEYAVEYRKIVEKACICVGLGTSALLVNDLDTKLEGDGVSVCPGPNLAYFSKEMTLQEMTDHIYGRTNVITRTDRPHMFINELRMYLDTLQQKFESLKNQNNQIQPKSIQSFSQNMIDGIEYYSGLLKNMKGRFNILISQFEIELENTKQTILALLKELEKLRVVLVVI
ncbi:MAG: hypothetical protein A2W93_04155 [Bacteroidetes bacterium GWF2_43_63]|nr:MAG: hypothetical protein A2W94_06060 [Bacteroidetes bacterium GWE2_42_42]OFY54375.1 MAG: hypothetical protein A2W93_04155 [Bacteroidetes bacterium GWF2_43_63]HBG69235.1 hypothetical protein [Bacteroidales bacterium]HCB61209.1 hypothetical protein [Bacteroidales bacterium]HCY24129.1 hypothetical protein [Bacteroidales bacterium]